MSNQTISTISTCWTIAATERSFEGFGSLDGSGSVVRDRHLADAGFVGSAHAAMAPKTTPATPAWRPRLS